MSSVGRLPRDRLLLALVLLCLVLYLPGMGWGIPTFAGPDSMHSWGNDDLVPLAPLAEMYNTFVQEEPLRNIAYPWFHYFLVAVAYSPYLLFLLLTGGLADPSSTYPYGLEDPELVFTTLTWIGRSVTLVLAVVLVVAVYYAGKYLWNRRAGFVAGLMATSMYPMAYYAKLGNLDVPALAWTSLGLAVSALVLRRGLTVRRGIALGAFMALAAATKDQAAGSFLLLVPALLALHHLSRSPESESDSGSWKPTLSLIGGFLAVYAFAGGALVDPQRIVEHTRLVLSVGPGLEDLYYRHPATVSGFAAQFVDLMRFLVEMLGWPVVLLALAGIVIALRSDRRACVLLLASVGFLLILLPVRFARIHYLLPVALPLTLFAGFAVSRGVARQGVLRYLTGGVAVLGLSVLWLRTADLNHAMIHDSRYDAGEWLARHARAGDQVLYFGAPLNNPPLPEMIGTERVDYRDRALEAVRSGRSEFVITVPEDTNEERLRVSWRSGRHSVHSDYLPPEVFDGLADGSLDYVLAAKFQTPRLVPWLSRPFLSYPTVNPPVHIFVRADRAEGMPRRRPWETAPHYPEPRGSYEPMGSETGE